MSGHHRPLRRFDWSLRSCGLHGHVTYRPDEEDLARRLHTETALGEAWRCLRCEDFVIGEPHGSGPAEDAPLVLRGNALKDAVILRLLAVERLLRALLLFALAYGVYRFESAKGSLHQVLQEYLPLLRPIGDRLGVDLEAAGPVKLIEEALSYSHATLRLVALGVLAYGLLQLLEATGLWLMRRWGEYVAAVATSIFIPLEVYEIVHTVSPVKIAALVLNVLAVVYLVWSKRLFGFRGGKEAFEAERHGASLLEVERSALQTHPHPV